MSKLKALGLALVAVLAIGAVGASAASAESADFAAALFPPIDIAGEEGNVHTFAVGALQTTCGQTVGGEKDVAVHGTGTLDPDNSILTTEEIQYTLCHLVALGITFPVTVDFNSCDYRFHGGTMEEGGGSSVGTLDIVCQKAEDEIVITVFDNAEHSPEKDRCGIHIPPQTGINGITYTNKAEGPHGKKAVTVDINATNLEATVTDTNKLGCNEHETDKEAAYSGVFWTEATGAPGVYGDAEVAGTPKEE